MAALHFRIFLKEAVNNVKTTESDLTRQEYLLSTGQIDDAHTVPAAAAKAQLSSRTSFSTEEQGIQRRIRKLHVLVFKTD